VHQDNKSTILLAENGKGSSSKRTRHIEIRYFFVKDRIDSGDLTVKYCPTGEMIANYFTKPLQGASFTKLRNEIMNVNPDHVDYALEDCRSVLNLANGTSWPTTNGHVASDGWVMEMAKPSKRMSHGSEQSPSVMRTGSRVNSGSRVNWAGLSTAERNEIIGEDE
jgi:hypothetical protein